MSDYLIQNHRGFNRGYTAITSINEAHHDTGIAFGILKLSCGETYSVSHPLESAYLLMQGECMLRFDDQIRMIKRNSLFEQSPSALHLSSRHPASIQAVSDVELAVFQVENNRVFPATLYDENNMLESQHRGKNILDNTAYRLVHTIFDTRNAPLSNLVLGEVITAPGRWSSYPPHHHPQPEIYHYRFTEPQGYGHSECGDDIFKVRQFDTYKILDSNNHAQVSAPGYGMYYLWVIRHLDRQPYIEPIFTKEHEWTKSHDANIRVWKSF